MALGCVPWAAGEAALSLPPFSAMGEGQDGGAGFMRKRYRRGLIDGSLLVKMRELRKHPTEAGAKL